MFAFNKFKKRRSTEIAPDEIFLDAHNSPNFDTDQFEGRIEQPISHLSITVFAIGLIVCLCIVLYKTFSLQIVLGETYREQAERNRLSHAIIFPERGVIYDRTGTLLAWNEAFDVGTNSAEAVEFSARAYATTTGLAHVLGYVRYPKKDSAGFYYQEETIGVAGLEKAYNTVLAGVPGRTIIEEDARGVVVSSSMVNEPEDGASIAVTIDAGVQDTLGRLMTELAADVGFDGGSSVIMDVHTGEIIALVNIPDFDPNVLVAGDEEALARYTNDPHTPFLNRAISGRYTPGSIIKPFVALGALAENIISPEKEIFSDGALRIPNPYNPDKPTIMKDWKAHGWTNMQEAIAVSSDVYFYTIGGGFGTQKGLGIDKIDEYVRLFEIGDITGIDLEGEVEGTIPTIAWKKELFPDDPWRVGDTYNTAIGQYGFQVTPIQMARATAAIANDGLLVTPHLIAQTQHPVQRIDVDPDELQIIREGMRLAVTDGTAKALLMSNVAMAGKTGTAELGVSKQNVNSWIIGFWPYENPRYAFATVMEHGPVTNLVGSASVMRRLFDWMSIHTPHYFEAL